MKNQIVRLKDYQPVAFEIKDVYLKFKLDPKKTIVNSKMNILPTGNSDLFLNGSQLKLKSIKINRIDASSLVTHNDNGIKFSKANLPKKQFLHEIITEINPMDSCSGCGVDIHNLPYDDWVIPDDFYDIPNKDKENYLKIGGIAAVGIGILLLYTRRNKK